MPCIAQIVQSGNLQAVQPARDFCFDVDEVEVSREGYAVVLRPQSARNQRWASLHIAVEQGFSSDFMVEEHEAGST